MRPPFKRQPAVPGPSGYPLLGVLPHFWRQPLQCLTAASHRYGEVVSLRLGGQAVYLLNHPAYIQQVLQATPQRYCKSVPRVARIKPLFGEGLTTSEGALWRRQRRLLQPIFQPQRLVAWASVITEAAAAMLARWRLVAARGQPLELTAAMGDLTQDIIGRILFGDDIVAAGQAFGQAVTTAVEQVNRRTWAVFAPPMCLPMPRHQRLRRALHTLDSFVYRMIEERRHRRSGRDDLLSQLLEACDAAAGEPMSGVQLRDEVMTLFIAGHTTVAAALAWICSLLAQHPDVERALRAELATVLGGRPPTAHDLPALTYTTMVIEEGLRLYPPTWVTARTPLTEDEIGGYPIPARAVLLLSPYVLHRHPAFWADPEQFDPERFTPERSVGRPAFVYFPFGGGPRRCIGQRLAMMEMVLILAMVAQRYRLRLMPGHPIEPEPRLTLRPRHGVLMTLHPHPC